MQMGVDVIINTGSLMRLSPALFMKSECRWCAYVSLASSMLSSMNRSVDPCQNFFEYACGAWNQRHVIPEDRSSVSTFEVLADQQQMILKGLLEEPRTDDENVATRKAKTFYKSCMDICEYLFWYCLKHNFVTIRSLHSN